MFAWAVLYGIMIRQPIPCGNTVHCSGNVTVSCYETTGERHFVEFLDKNKAEKFVANLAPYNFRDVLDHDVPNNKRFIQGLELHTYKKIHGEWKDVTPPSYTLYELNKDN